ncbi:MAG: hydantoinase B/oxoprolinase family protein [Actinomycetes bacterium]
MNGSGQLSPAHLQVLITRLSGVADEMGAVLRRAAYSPNIKERADCSAAVFDPAGRLVAQAEHIPVHLGSMPASVAAVIRAFGDSLGPGEQAMVNDPYDGGTHLNDITVVAPCWVDGTLVGWVANRAHHADVGGDAPGSMPADATHIDHEGARFGPTLITPDARAALLAASRTPAERAGDLDAQLGANVVGVRRLAALADAPTSEVLDHGERQLRARLRALPDGEWSAVDVLDSFGPAADQQRPVTLRCTVRLHGERITFDLSDSDPQVVGNMNAVRAVTVSAVLFALKAVLDPELPSNAGVDRVVDVVTRPGSVLDAQFPAAVGAGNVEVSQRVAEVAALALAGAVPGRVAAASQGTMNNVLIGAGDGAEAWVYYETLAGGQGGRPADPARADARPVAGMSGVHTGMTNTLNTPVEALERSYAMRVRRLRLRRGSGGQGLAAGGEGVEREIELLEDATVSLITERRTTAPWGAAGGSPGGVGVNQLLVGGDPDAAVDLPDKATFAARAGDVVRMWTPGGGGWGSPR